MQDLLARLAIRRTFADAQSDAPVTDFQESRRCGVLRQAAVGLVVSGLAVLGAGGVAAAAAASSTQQASVSIVQDTNNPDTSHAAPQNLKLDAQQQAQANAAGNTSTGNEVGGLFGQRGTTPNRNSVRAELSSTLANAKGQQRAVSLQANDKSVTDAQAKAEATERQKLMDADIEKVKAEAERIKEEKRKAAELLKQLQAGNNASGFDLSVEDLQAITKGGAAMPLKAGTYTMSASFGKTGVWARYHTGQDFAAPTGTPVYAASSGIIGQSRAGWWAGTHIVLNHGNGGSTLYAHLSGTVVSPGQPVKAGQLIGYVGNTGNSHGSHLHFEYYPAGTLPGDVYSAADPMAWLRGIGVA
ncbi:M23 family metallopeptidase [Propionibacteriaceae bacterium Y1923]|uniref:M23 family metallopeptidase n=1 Tax=Aestuariimicrobium sp. Y1814 TaxID=3418742 RepID=UPI003C1C4BAF